MSLSFTGVVAMSADRAIGLNGTMPWRLPDDLKLFKRLTMGHPILMGRKTWDSLGVRFPAVRILYSLEMPIFMQMAPL